MLYSYTIGNALIHCNWADSIPIQIRIEDEAMYISNCCILPSRLCGSLGTRNSKNL